MAVLQRVDVTAMAERLMWGLRHIVFILNPLSHHEEHHQDKSKTTLNLYETLNSFHVAANRILDSNDEYNMDWSYIL